MALVLKATQECDLAIEEIVDAFGNPATIDGAPVWGVSETGKVEIDVGDDGMTAVVRALGPVTSTPVQVNVTADADMGSGVKPIVGVLEVSVIAGDAVAVVITAGTPVEQGGSSGNEAGRR